MKHQKKLGNSGKKTIITKKEKSIYQLGWDDATKGLSSIKSGHPRFYKLLEEISDIHERKNQNYATKEDPLSNLKQSEKIGIPAYKGCFIRMQDKFDRLTNLMNGQPDMVGESMADTLTDLAVYSLLCRILMEEHEKNT